MKTSGNTLQVSSQSSGNLAVHIESPLGTRSTAVAIRCTR